MYENLVWMIVIDGFALTAAISASFIIRNYVRKANLVETNKTTVIMSSIPLCQVCSNWNGNDVAHPAEYDGKTIHGPWAYMCEAGFQQFGIGLGTGKGQKFVESRI